MKKIIAILLALFALSLVSCNKTGNALTINGSYWLYSYEYQYTYGSGKTEMKIRKKVLHFEDGEVTHTQTDGSGTNTTVSTYELENTHITFGSSFLYQSADLTDDSLVAKKKSGEIDIYHRQ